MGDARGSKVKSKQGPEMGAKERRRAKKSPVGSGWRRVLSMFPNTTWVWGLFLWAAVCSGLILYPHLSTPFLPNSLSIASSINPSIRLPPSFSLSPSLLPFFPFITLPSSPTLPLSPAFSLLLPYSFYHTLLLLWPPKTQYTFHSIRISPCCFLSLKKNLNTYFLQLSPPTQPLSVSVCLSLSLKTNSSHFRSQLKVTSPERLYLKPLNEICTSFYSINLYYYIFSCPSWHYRNLTLSIYVLWLVDPTHWTVNSLRTGPHPFIIYPCIPHS